MFVKVDNGNEKEIEGFMYTNKVGFAECVVLKGNWVELKVDGDSNSCIYYEDIPKAIKALQAAYDLKKAQQ